MAPSVLRPPVLLDLVELDVPVELKTGEFVELRTEEREEESPELVDEDPDVLITEPLKEEVGGDSDVTEGRVGMEVGLSRQTSELPGLTVIAGVALPSPSESASTITTLVPAEIVTGFQVNEVPVMLVKAATTVPSALPPVWKD